MFKLLVLTAILAITSGSPVPKPLTLGLTETHLTPVVTSYSQYPTVHNYHTVRTYPSPVVSYTGFDTPVLTHHTYGSPSYVHKYLL